MKIKPLSILPVKGASGFLWSPCCKLPAKLIGDWTKTKIYFFSLCEFLPLLCLSALCVCDVECGHVQNKNALLLESFVKMFLFLKATKTIPELLKILLTLYLFALRLAVPQRYKADEATLLSLIKPLWAISKEELLLCPHAAVTESRWCLVLPSCSCAWLCPGSVPSQLWESPVPCRACCSCNFLQVCGAIIKHLRGEATSFLLAGSHSGARSNDPCWEQTGANRLQHALLHGSYNGMAAIIIHIGAQRLPQ